VCAGFAEAKCLRLYYIQEKKPENITWLRDSDIKVYEIPSNKN